MNLADWRKEYGAQTLRRADLEPTPAAQLKKWIAELDSWEYPEPNAMVLATVSARQQTSVRTVLLKGVSEQGFIFYTNYESAKAQEIALQAQVSLLFPWHAVERQVKVLGEAERLSEEENAAYFASRPRESQLGAWASRQSKEIGSREALEAQLEEQRARFAGKEVPLPPFWGGYRVKPTEVEFWQGGLGRVHDRLVYTFLPQEQRWQLSRLQP